MNINNKFADEKQLFIKQEACPVCGKAAPHDVNFNIKYRSNKVIELNAITKVPNIKLLRCKYCNHYFASHVLKPEILNNYYANINSELYLDQSNNPSDTFVGERKKIITLIEKLMRNGGSILDVGCGYGFLLSYLQKDKWKCYGVEPSNYASQIASANGIKIVAPYINLIKPSEYKFDIILLMDVIEHIIDSNDLIKILYNLLKPRGYLIIETGNINSLNSKICGSKWAYFGSYEHISFYNPQSISFLLKKNGFRIIKIQEISHRSGFLINGIYFLKNIAKYVMSEKLKKREYSYNLAFDHMLVIARQ